MDSRYRAFVKSSLDLNGLPKAFFSIISGSVSGDILTNSSSSFVTEDTVSKSVENGDVLCLYKSNGQIIYSGVITSIEPDDKNDSQRSTINTSSIYSLFDTNWFTRFFRESNLEHEIYDVLTDFMSGSIGTIVTSLPTADEDNYFKNQNYFLLNNDVYEQYRVNRQEDTTQSTEDKKVYTYSIDKVGEVAVSDIGSITDSMIANRFSAFNVQYTDSQDVHLTYTDELETARNMEEFIHKIYNDYGVVVEIVIPYGSGCRISIKTVDYSGTKIAKNTANIISISPTNEIEELNKLIVLSSTGAYRNTYYATENGIVTDSSDENRLLIVNTNILYSDDTLDNIKAEHLKEEMYNHQIVFEMLMENKLYDFYSWSLGMPLEIYYKGVYYKSIFTGYSYSFDENERPGEVQVTCGKVRTRLTDLINMGKV